MEMTILERILCSYKNQIRAQDHLLIIADAKLSVLHKNKMEIEAFQDAEKMKLYTEELIAKKEKPKK